MNTNIPLFRAKKIDTEECVVGYLVPEYDGYHCIHVSWVDDDIRIDPSTLSIHFKDMLASDSDRLLPNGEKDLRIFASLSQDGKGGDMLRFEHFNKNKNKCGDYFACYTQKNIAIRSIHGDNFWMGSASLKSIKIVGIRQ